MYSLLWYFSKLPCGINHPTLEDVEQSPKDLEKKQEIKLILETSPTVCYDSLLFTMIHKIIFEHLFTRFLGQTDLKTLTLQEAHYFFYYTTLYR